MKSRILYGLLIIVVLGAGYWIWKTYNPGIDKKAVHETIIPGRGNIEVLITTTGTVQPQNRLEMKPPISGRIENILVVEGSHVKKGEIIAWMSSTDRAALLDAARSRGMESLKQWEDVYKPTPLIAPINGEVIVRAVEPGQSVTPNDPVVVLSDRLIVKAQVDETDIGRVKVGQNAFVSLDAYPGDKVIARVDHISYESKLISNVTIYEVDILPQRVPKVFRSGMTANVNIIEKSRRDVLRLPLDAVRREKDGSFVLVKEPGQGKSVSRKVETGLSDENFVEITSGLNEQDVVMVEKKNSVLPGKNTSGGSPFMPSGRPKR
ncbi:MAG: efflux RND transporter periplasmic adaptor subunit [Nitrospirae bacterium]|nr:efflux RND transporter periplasmic adaptor subunit [Nitrospirota bacterium]